MLYRTGRCGGGAVCRLEDWVKAHYLVELTGMLLRKSYPQTSCGNGKNTNIRLVQF